MEIERNLKQRPIKKTQTGYIKNILQTFGMETANTLVIPAVITCI